MPERRGPIRVLFLASADFFSGAERALLLTAKSLVDAGHEPFVVVGRDPELLRQLQQQSIPAARVPLYTTGADTLHKWSLSMARLVSIGFRHRAVIVHANEIASAQMAGYAARVLRIPAVTHVRFPEEAGGFAWYLKSGFRRALFVSDALRRDAEAVAPALFANRSEVVYDGVSIPPIPDATERVLRRSQLKIPSDRPAVLLAGQVIAIKGIWDYIEAAKLLVERGARATFAVLGDDLKGHGATRRDAEGRVKALGLEEHVRFLGFRPDAPVLIPLFDITAVPSHIEPLGNATLEAMAAGRPVVGSRVGGIPEMVVDGETGLLVPPQAPTELASALGRLIADPQLAAQLGSAGRRRAEQVFSLSAHAEHLNRIYRQQLQARGVAPRST